MFKKIFLLTLVTFSFSCNFNKDEVNQKNKYDSSKTNEDSLFSNLDARNEKDNKLYVLNLIDNFEDIDNFIKIFKSLENINEKDLYDISIYILEKILDESLCSQKAEKILEFFQKENPDILNINKKINIKILEEEEIGTLLHKYVIEGKYKAVELLLNLGADFSIKNKDGNTSYDLAKTYEHNSILDMLNKRLVNKKNFIDSSILKIDEDINKAKFEDNECNFENFKLYFNSSRNKLIIDDLNDAVLKLIVMLAYRKNEKIVIELIKIIFENTKELKVNINGKIRDLDGLNLNIVREIKSTLSEIFLINNKWELLEYFSKELNVSLELEDKEISIQRFLVENIDEINIKAVDYIIEKLGLDFDKGILYQLLKLYVKNNNLEKVSAILVKGLDENKINDILFNKKSTVDPLIIFLLEKGLNKKYNERIDNLIKYFFINELINIDFKKRFSLSLAALLRNNNLEQENFSSVISLIKAFNNDHEKFKLILEILIENGANINKKSEVDGDIPLHTAIRKDLLEVTEILIRNGSKLNLKSSNKESKINLTALRLAILRRSSSEIFNKIKELYKILKFEIHPEDINDFNNLNKT